jgi:hypothetical protein
VIRTPRSARISSGRIFRRRWPAGRRHDSGDRVGREAAKAWALLRIIATYDRSAGVPTDGSDVNTWKPKRLKFLKKIGFVLQDFATCSHRLCLGDFKTENSEVLKNQVLEVQEKIGFVWQIQGSCSHD